ncbi:hypothetical protein ACFPMF_08295 [Larkinella bovis]|uniref:Uncharacterized protein n=1 Tax=Larkinella bovis TaxID=683041 RepID=A0ABW0I700_9BACT
MITDREGEGPNSGFSDGEEVAVRMLLKHKNRRTPAVFVFDA